ncbi:MAG: hypothetical protein AB7P04_02525 [Bacteriovoracia bacterium]
MRTKLSPNTSAPPPVALVLGPAAMATRLSEDLNRLGFQCIRPRDLTVPFPSPAHPGSLNGLKRALMDFRKLHPANANSQNLWVHPGTSAWADRAELLRAAEEHGVQVVAPSARMVSLFANKLNLLTEAEKLGIPHLVMSFEPIQSLREVEEVIFNAARREAYESAQFEGKSGDFSFCLRSIHSADHLGRRVFYSLKQLEKELPIWLELLRLHVGEAILFAQRTLDSSRLIRVPFARFNDGDFVGFPLVDASLQARQRQFVEFCPPLTLDREVETQLLEYVTLLTEKLGYVGLGAFEFQVEGNRAYLVDALSHLDASYALWENIAGTSAVAWQLGTLWTSKPAPELKLKPKRASLTGASLRIFAEDSFLQIPQPGFLAERTEKTKWKTPAYRAELDCGLAEGEGIEGLADDATEQSDGWIAQLHVFCPQARSLIASTRKVLSEQWFAGSLQTNERMLREILEHPWVQEGVFHLGFLDEDFVPQIRPPQDLDPLIGALCASVDPEQGRPVEASPKDFSWLVGERKLEPAPVRLQWKSGPKLWQTAAKLWAVSGTLEPAKGTQLRVCAFPVSPIRWQVRIGDFCVPVRRMKRVPKTGGAAADRPYLKLYAQAAGRVHAIMFREKSRVPARECLLTLESLQTMIPHQVPVPIQIKTWHVKAEDHVQVGQVLAEFELSPK